LDFIECEKVQNAGYCADNDCDCSLTPLPRGGGYIYISDEVADFRKDALSLTEVQAKLEKLTGSGEYISVSKYAPILVCEEAAYRRNLDMVLAKEDARLYWKEGKVPLRATPLAKNNDELIRQDPFQQFRQSDLEQASENINENPVENEQAPEFKEPENLSMPVQILSDVNKQDAALRDVSVDDVLNQFSSGPLAELAKRMAQGLGNEDSEPSGNSISGLIPETIVSSGAKLRRMDEEYDENPSSQYTPPRKAPSNTKIRKTKQKQIKRSISPVIFTIFGIVTLSVIAAITAIVIVKLRQPKPVAVVVQPQETVEPSMEISRSFFEKSYLFEDAHCKGTISFPVSNETGGEYIQAVNLKGKDKTYKVHGVFTYTTNSITFRPDSYLKDIVWILDEYDQDGNVVFHDPSEQNIETARVYLRREN
jgi:hypothetical protein